MLNENIKKYRKAKGLSQEELAERLNVVRQTVSKWETGLSVPDSQSLIRPDLFCCHCSHCHIISYAENMVFMGST